MRACKKKKQGLKKFHVVDKILVGRKARGACG